jgi:hypothetical protein
MPGRDGTGPMGMGPMSGGGRGFCAVPVSDIRPGPLGRRCFGRGNGRGFGNAYFAPGAIDEVSVLKEQLKMIQERLEAIEKAKGSEE